MHLVHLCLAVRDELRSRLFYQKYFGFWPDDAVRPENGTVPLRNTDGFQLTLHVGQEVSLPSAALHFGFRTTTGDDVRAMADRLEADGVPIISRYDTPAKVAFQCVDPDGYRVETYWETGKYP